MDFSANITKRTRRRKLRKGQTVTQVRYVLSYRDPLNKSRRQEFFARQSDAAARRNQLIADVVAGTYADRRKAPTVSSAIDHWLGNLEGQVKAPTLAGYKVTVAHIRGPLILAPPAERARISARRQSCQGLNKLPLLGDVKIMDLTPGLIRGWYKTIAQEVGTYTANRAKSHLKAILELAEEDFGVRGPSMPSKLSRGRPKVKKTILTAEQIKVVLAAAQQDLRYGVYYAFPFLAGTRPSEQLGLLWDDIDFERGVIRIRRVQERDGTLTEITKTAASTRDIPLGPYLREMLLEWRQRCPRREGEPNRVFPGPGQQQTLLKPATRGGGPLIYQNFRNRAWEPNIRRLAIPYVTPHSARHSFISILQAQGIEVGLVAKLAGHANATVTLAHYTQAVRGGHEAVARLERAYSFGGIHEVQG